MLPFSPQEYKSRLEATWSAMDDTGLDLLWVTSPPNMNYLCGYDAWSFYVHQGVLIARDEPCPFWLGRQIDVACARLTTFLGEEHIHGYGDEYLGEGKHGMDFVARFIKQRGWAKRRIGIEMDTHFFTAKAYQRLRLGLSKATFADATGLVNWQRIVKSPDEINYMRQAGIITDTAMRRAIDTIAPGVRQCDVAAEIYHALIAGHSDYYGDVPDYQTLPMGERTAAPHLTWTGERYRTGQSCTLELGANRHRYHAPLARTVYLGCPPSHLVDLSAVVEEGLESALDVVRPGTTCEQVERAWRDTAAKAKVVKRSRIGYSVGIGYPPDWGEYTASIMPGDKTELRVNMVFHLMLGIWNPTGGYELSETFVVTDTGHECLSRLPRSLVVKNG